MNEDIAIALVALAIVIIVCFTIITALVMIGVIRAVPNRREALAKFVQGPDQQDRREEPQAEPEQRQESASPPDGGLPVPVDPDRPPTMKIYRPRPGSTAETPRCACHQRPVNPGDKVLWWPVPGSEEVRVFCQRGADL